MNRPLVLLVIAGLLGTSALVSAGLLAGVAGGDAVTPTAYRVGDQLRYEERVFPEGDEPAPVRTQLVKVEGPNTTTDRFGLEVATDDFVVQTLDDEAVEWEYRCHEIRDGNEAVRRDWLFSNGTNFWNRGSSISKGPIDALSSERVRETSGFFRVSYDNSSCARATPFAGVSLGPGTVLSVADLFDKEGPEEGEYRIFGGRNTTSEPARLIDFNGRPALEFTFHFNKTETFTFSDMVRKSMTYGTAVAVLADGLPGVVRSDANVTFQSLDPETGEPGEPQRVRYVTELTGFVPGEGEAIPDESAVRLTYVDADAERVPFDGQMLDDKAFNLPFPYADAFAAIDANGETGLAAFLEKHPEATLGVAWYDRREEGRFPGTVSEGGWTILLADETALWTGHAVKLTHVETPAGVVPLPAPQVETDGGSTENFYWPHGHPGPEVVSSTAMAEAFTAAGISTDAIESMVFLTYHGIDTGEPGAYTVAASTVSHDRPDRSPDTEGLMVEIDAVGNGYLYVADVIGTYTSNGLYSPFPVSTDPAWQVRGQSTPGLASIPLGTGLAVTAAVGTAVAALLIAVKFFALPFYTRLRRDRLLDNPVRARLYECIRANPGITRGELVDYMGLGQSPTHHHLDKLVEAQFLVMTETDRHVRFFASGELPPGEARKEAILRAGSNRRVYELFRAEPHLSLRDAAARLGMSAPSVHRSVKKLREAGLLPASGAEGSVEVIVKG